MKTTIMFRILGFNLIMKLRKTSLFLMGTFKWSEVKYLSHVWLSATPWTVAHQAPLSMDFPGKSTGLGGHFLLQGSSWLWDQTQVSHTECRLLTI